MTDRWTNRCAGLALFPLVAVLVAAGAAGAADLAARAAALRSPEVAARRAAADALAALGRGAADAIPDLVAALADPDAGVRWRAAVALGNVGPAAVAPLAHALGSAAAASRQGAALALGWIGGDAAPALSPLRDALLDRDAGVRERAAEAIGRIGPGAAPAVPALVRAFSDPDAYVQGKAAEALGRIGREAVPALTAALGDKDAGVRWCAAVALGRIGAAARDAIPALTRALVDPDANVRWCATIALGSIGPPAASAAGALVESLHDRDEDVRWGANLALARVGAGPAALAGDWRAAAATLETLTPALMKELRVPGVAIALVADRRLVWTRSFGVADARDGRPVTDATLFEACSMSKPVFAYVVMKLAELGRLDLDAPLAAYLPEEHPPAQPEKARITARMALSHTTGFPNWRKGDEEREGPLPVTSSPGSRFAYSGEGIFYLQRAVERITGEPLDVLAGEMLFEPAGLRHMSYVWTPELDAALAAGHTAEGAFLLKTKYTHPNAAYSLYTSAADYAAFLVEIMKADRSASHSLSRRSLDAMLAHEVALDARDPIERPGAARGTAVWWGLGWSINATASGDIAHHSGSNRSGFRCFSQFSPSRGSAIVVMTNGAGGGELWTRLISRVGDL